MLDKVTLYLASLTPLKIIFLSTFFVLFSSVPLVYLFVVLAGVEYTIFLFSISAILPLILTPITVFVLINLTTKLQYFQKHLEDEIEKNKAKDVMLFEQARFVLMGEMMANISHQWKQPLNTINLALLNMKFSNPDFNSKDKNYDIIENNVNYLASTIDDFMSFFDKRVHKEIKPLDNIIKELYGIMDAHMANKKIDLEILLDDGYAEVSVAASISQVIINLINNGKDALEDVKDKKIRVHFLVSESGLEIECCDNGSGIDEKIKNKIFNPYFTTKAKSQGTGIGLYMSKEIILKIFEGTIRVKKRDGLRNTQYEYGTDMTTCFYIFLPYSTNCLLKENIE